MSTSQIDIYHALQVTQNGRVDMCGTSPLEAAVSIAGTADPATPGGDTVAVAAAAKVRIYDYGTNGGFEVFSITPSGDCTLWIQSATPETGTDAKAAATWFPLRLKADRPFVLTSDLSKSHADVTLGCGDTADEPTGATDSGEVDARIHALEVANEGTAAITVTWVRRN